MVNINSWVKKSLQYLKCLLTVPTHSTKFQKCVFHGEEWRSWRSYLTHLHGRKFWKWLTAHHVPYDSGCNPIIIGKMVGKPLGWRAPSCLTPPVGALWKGIDIPNRYPLYKVYMGLIIKGPPSQGYHHFPYDITLSSCAAKLMACVLSWKTEGSTGWQHKAPVHQPGQMANASCNDDWPFTTLQAGRVSNPTAVSSKQSIDSRIFMQHLTKSQGFGGRLWNPNSLTQVALGQAFFVQKGIVFELEQLVISVVSKHILAGWCLVMSK